MKIGILQTGKSPKEISDKYGSYAQMFINLLKQKNTTFEFEIFEVYENILPKNQLDCDGWIITGSKHSTYEKLSWIKPLERLIIDIVKSNKPILGVCFGHQIIAQALGGLVKKSTKGWGLGIDTYKLNNKTNYMSNLPNEVIFNIIHQDQVIKLPKDAIAYLSSDFCKYAGFYINHNVLTIQAHPEFLTSFNRDLLKLRRSAIEPEHLVDLALKEIKTNKKTIGSNDFFHTISSFFLQFDNT